MSDEPVARRRQGVTYALAGYCIWGCFPVYFTLFENIPAHELLANRVVWVSFFVSLMIILQGHMGQIIAIFRDKHVFGYLCLSSAFLSLNWGFFIWAVHHNFILQTSLGYYINPLVSVLLGVVFLREKLRRVQWIAVAIASAGVLVMTYFAGEFPWVSLVLAFSFGFYGLIRNRVAVSAANGLLTESILATPIAFLWLAWLAYTGANAITTDDSPTRLLTVVSIGIMTTIPLLFFAAAARRLPLSELGFYSYVTPSGHFLLAVFYFDEPFSTAHLLSFTCIWSALSLYSLDSYLTHKRAISNNRPP